MKIDGKIRKEPPYKIQRKLSGNSKESRFITDSETLQNGFPKFRTDFQFSERIRNVLKQIGMVELGPVVEA